MLMRMYLKWAERHRFEVEVIDQSPGEEAGLKSVTFIVRGPHAYGLMRSEHGVHRLVRLSPLGQNHRRHTAFALGQVIPELDDTHAHAVGIHPQAPPLDTYQATRV